MMAAAPFIGSALPQLIITTDGATNLFQYAARFMGDAMQAWRIADLNGGIDFWPAAGVTLKIPKPAPNNGGIPYT